MPSWVYFRSLIPNPSPQVEKGERNQLLIIGSRLLKWTGSLFEAAIEIDSAYETYNLKDHFIFNKKGIYNVTYFYHEIDEKYEIKIESNILKVYIDD